MENNEVALCPIAGYSILTGPEALKWLVDGNMISIGGSVEYKLDSKTGKLFRHVMFGDDVESNIELGHVVLRSWYAKHPFDVRKLMKEQPNEWVGAFFSENFVDDHRLMRIGFSAELMSAIALPFDNLQNFIGFTGPFERVTAFELDHSFSLDDVPKSYIAQCTNTLIHSEE